MQVTRRSILSGLFSLIPASLMPASKAVLKEQKHGDGVRRWKNYRCPKTWWDAITFISDHGGKVLVEFDAQSGNEKVIIQIGDWYSSWQHPCSTIKPKDDIADYYDTYFIPMCAVLWSAFYKRKIPYGTATENQPSRS